MKLVGLTLVAALSGRLLTVDGAVTAEKVTDNFLMGFNLARTARIDVQGPLLTKDDTLENNASTELTSAITTDSSCESEAQAKMQGGTPFEGFYLVLPSGYQDEEAYGTNDVENELFAALQQLGTNTQGGVGTVFKPSEAPFSNQSVRNTAYMMFQTSLKVGCARTAGCTDQSGQQYLLCLFTPTLVKEQSIPFPTALYDAMVAREKAGVTLVKLTKDALQTPLTVPTPPCGGGAGGAGGEGAASYALPGVGLLLFTVTGMLAF
ncbi:hypothetical protein Emed_003295 [Eimeria media]